MVLHHAAVAAATAATNAARAATRRRPNRAAIVTPPETDEQQGHDGPQALRDRQAVPERQGAPGRGERHGRHQGDTGDQPSDPGHHIVPFWPPVRHPWRPSLRQAVGVWPDQRRKARVKALASE